MGLDDFIEPEVGIAVALTAAVASPGVRKVLRKGAVYGLAGVLMAGDAISTLAQGIKRGVQQAAPADMPDPVTEEASEMPPEILSTRSVEPIPTASADPVVPEVHAAPKRVRKTAEVPTNG